MPIFVRIKQLAKQRNSSISQIERTLNLGNGTIRRWDTNIPSADKVLSVANLLNVSTEYLLTGENNCMPRHFDIIERENILNKAKNLSDKDFETLEGVINALLRTQKES